MIVGIELAKALNDSTALANALRTGGLDKLLDLTDRDIEASLIPWGKGSEQEWLSAVKGLNAIPAFPTLYEGNLGIKVLSTPMNDVRYTSYHLKDDIEVVSAARQSTKQGIGKDKEITDEIAEVRSVKYMWKHHHTSPFEQVPYQFELEIPKFVESQLVRHRTAKLNEQSLRFTELTKNDNMFAKMTIADWRLQHKEKLQCSAGPAPQATSVRAMDIYHVAMEQAESNYKRLLDLGISREQARTVLPVSHMTSLKWQMDLSNLSKFIMLRADPHAQLEIQETTWPMVFAMRSRNPLTYLFLVQTMAFQRTFAKAQEQDNTKLLMKLVSYI